MLNGPTKFGGKRPFDRRPGHYTSWEERQLNDRLSDLKIAYRAYKTKLEEAANENLPCVANPTTLTTICYLYVNDVKEFKLLHDAQGGIDHRKRAAYLARLIAKLRPIELDRRLTDGLPEGTRTSRRLAYVNENFAIFVFLRFLGISLRGMDSPVLPEILRQLRYVFTHREAQRELLVALASATEFAVKGRAAKRAYGST
jgi:hypothetical protein